MVLKEIACRNEQHLNASANKLNEFFTQLGFDLKDKKQRHELNNLVLYTLKQQKCQDETSTSESRKVQIFETLKIVIFAVLVLRVITGIIKHDAVAILNKILNIVEGILFAYIGISLIVRFDSSMLTLEVLSLKTALVILSLLSILVGTYTYSRYRTPIVIVSIFLILSIFIYIAHKHQKTIDRSVFENMSRYMKLQPYSVKLPTFMDCFFIAFGGWVMLSKGVGSVI